MQFTYKTVTLQADMWAKDMGQAVINEWAAAGWELASVVVVPRQGMMAMLIQQAEWRDGSMTLYFKRSVKV